MRSAFCSARCCFAAIAAQRAACAELAEPADQADRADRPGRRHRRDGAADGRERLARARPAGGGGEPAGRVRHHRAPDRRARRAGRLHVPVHQHLGPRHQSGDVQDAALRSGEGLHAGRHGGRLRPADAVGQRRAAGEDRRRADRLRQGQSRQAVLRGRRHRGRRAVRRAAPQQARQSRHGRGALPFRRADGAGRGERHRSGADLIDGRRQRHGAGRQDPPPRADPPPSAFRRCPTCRPSTKRCRA